jgi:hypothetical protein
MCFFSRSKFYRLQTILIAGVILFASCNDPDLVGLDVQPPGDKINFGYTDTTKVTAYTVREDSLRTDEISLYLLGSYTDSVFGRTDAGIFAQPLLPSSNVNLGDSLSVDSIVLTLGYTGLYGDSFPAQVFHVYKLTEDMHFDSAYYSNRVFSYDPSEVGSATITPAPHDSIPQLRIRLSNQFGDEFRDMSNNGQLTTNANFLTLFKGLYIKTDPVISGGGIFYVNLLTSLSKLTLYYSSGADDSLSFSFPFTTESARMTHFAHDYSLSPIQQQLNDSLNGDSLVYVQSMAGVKTKIRFPNLKNYISNGMIAVNKAELEITVTSNSNNRFAAPDKLLILGVNADGKPVFLPDQLESSSYYGGNYSSSDRKYKFNIARYVQNVLAGIPDYGLYLAVSGGAVQGNRVILGGSTNPAYRMKLNLFLTKPH